MEHEMVMRDSLNNSRYSCCMNWLQNMNWGLLEFANFLGSWQLIPLAVGL